MKPDTRNITLFPKRLSAVSHGHFVADQQGMSFRFHTYLNPQSVYGVMLRLRQASWLDSFDTIVCDSQEDMWEIRKRFPKVAFRTCYLWDDDTDPPDGDRMLCIEARNDYRSGRYWYDETEWVSLQPLCTLRLDDLAPVATITANYK